MRQITAQKHAGEDGRGDVDEIKIQSRARRAEYGACAHAEDKAGTCIVAKAQQTLGFFAPERTGGKQLRDRARADRIAAHKTERQRARTRAAETEERTHHTAEQAGKGVRRTAGDEQGGEHKKRKERRNDRPEAERHSVARCLRALLGKEQQSRSAYREQQEKENSAKLHTNTSAKLYAHTRE